MARANVDAVAILRFGNSASPRLPAPFSSAFFLFFFSFCSAILFRLSLDFGNAQPPQETARDVPVSVTTCGRCFLLNRAGV